MSGFVPLNAGYYAVVSVRRTRFKVLVLLILALAGESPTCILLPVAPVACQVILGGLNSQFRDFESPRAHTRINSLGLFLAHKLTCGKRERVSERHSMRNRRAVGLLNPIRDKTLKARTGGDKGRHL